MTIWVPDLSGSALPRYLAVVEAIAADLAGGRLRPGDRLPPQRELAFRLGVTVGTVTRAYQEAERRGLVVGEVGRGTFLRPDRTGPNPLSLLTVPEPGERNQIDLGRNQPPEGPAGEALRRTLTEMARAPDLGEALAYQPAGGLARHRLAGAAWIGRRGFAVPAEEVLVTAGGQHGLVAALMTFCRPGDTVLTEDLTYPGIRSQAALLGLRLQGLPMDRDGLRPDALEAACQAGTGRLLYFTSFFHNPTGTSMSEGRRRAIADILVRHGLPAIEDDVYGPLVPDGELPAAAFAPDLILYLFSAKVLAPGLRVGFLRVPPARLADVSATVRATLWMAPPLTVEVAARWIEDGTADALVRWHREEAAARAALLSETMAGAPCRIERGGYHAWMHLPDPWRATDFAQQARARGVVVQAAETFVAGRGEPPHAVRLSLGCPPDRASLIEGQGILRRLLEEKPRIDSSDV